MTALLCAASTLAFPSFSFVGNWENGRGRKSEEGRGSEKRWGSSNLIDPRNQITVELIILFPFPPTDFFPDCINISVLVGGGGACNYSADRNRGGENIPTLSRIPAVNERAQNEKQREKTAEVFGCSFYALSGTYESKCRVPRVEGRMGRWHRLHKVLVVVRVRFGICPL